MQTHILVHEHCGLYGVVLETMHSVVSRVVSEGCEAALEERLELKLGLDEALGNAADLANHQVESPEHLGGWVVESNLAENGPHGR